MSRTVPLLDQELQKRVDEITRLYKSELTSPLQQAVIEGRIVLGMSLHVAKRLGGDCFYKVKVDMSIWPLNSDPALVIAKQETHPDESKIWLVFENSTQFPDKGITRFSVYF